MILYIKKSTMSSDFAKLCHLPHFVLLIVITDGPIRKVYQIVYQVIIS
jgi:hypothetical protein